MLAVSGRWAAQIAANHAPLYRVEAWKTNQRLIANLAVDSATLTKDAGAYPRSTATVSVADTSPSTAQLLTPFGTRLRFFRGLRYPDNTTELPLVADLDITAASFRRPDNSLTLECADPSARVAAATLPGPWRPPGNEVGAVRYVEAIQALINRGRAYPPAQIRDDSPNGNVSKMFVNKPWQADGDPWDAIEQLLDPHGLECFFTPDRIPVIRAVPPVKTTADANLYALAGGTVVATDSQLTREPNIIYVLGEPDEVTGKQPMGYALDSAPASPTYYGGAYGTVVRVENRPSVRTNGEATAAAQQLLARVQGRVRTVDLECVPNPALEPGDTVAIKFSNGAIERHTITRVTVPFGPGTDDVMQVSTRTTTYTTAGWP